MKRKIKHERRLTVSYISVSQSYYRFVNVPLIRISGMWLNECGFHQGTKVRVTIGNNMLTIKAEGAKEESAKVES